MDRDRTKQLTAHRNEVNRKKQELNLTKNLRKEVEVGANGTQKYVIKEGKNKGKAYDLKDDLDKFYNKGQKAAGTRIRACMMELAKLAKAAKNDTLDKK